MTGAELITAQLRAQGIGTVFSLAGASHTYLLESLDRDGFTIVSSRHESGAVGAADGYARALADQRPQRPGIAMIVSPQGLANAVPGLAVAQAIGSPVVVLAAIPPGGFLEPEDIIASAQLDIVRPVCKWVSEVPSAEHLAGSLRAAMEASLEGRPGPVVLFIPQQFFRTDLNVGAPGPIEIEVPVASARSLEEAAAILDRAERPVAIAGIGAFRGRTANAMRELAERGVPVLGNGTGRGLVTEDHTIGWSWPYSQREAHRADCVIVVGEVLTQRLGFGLPPRFAEDAKFIQLDVNGDAFDRNRTTDAALHGEPGAALETLLERSEKHWDGTWLIEALGEKDELLSSLDTSGDGPAHPLALARAIESAKPDKALIIGDGADIQNWLYGAVRIEQPGGFMDHFPLGAMGSGTALAIGAAAAMLEAAGDQTPRPVLLLTGDGSIGFYPAELHAAALAGLNLKVIIGNDAAWGTEAHGQQEAIGKTINTELGDLPYAKLGEAFGVPSAECRSTGELEEKLGWLFAQHGSALVDVKLDPAAGVELKTGSLASSILFSDLEEGKSALEQAREATP